MIFRFSEGCLINTNLPFELSQHAKIFTSKNRKGDISLPSPLGTFFAPIMLTRYRGKPYIVKTVGMDTNEIFLA